MGCLAGVAVGWRRQNVPVVKNIGPDSAHWTKSVIYIVRILWDQGGSSQGRSNPQELHDIPLLIQLLSDDDDVDGVTFTASA